jgi:hypothetical protein
MNFEGGILRSGGSVVMESVSGRIDRPTPSGALTTWGGALNFPSVVVAMEVFNKQVNPTELEIPGVLRARIVINDLGGNFTGSGVPEILGTK